MNVTVNLQSTRFNPTLWYLVEAGLHKFTVGVLVRDRVVVNAAIFPQGLLQMPLKGSKWIVNCKAGRSGNVITSAHSSEGFIEQPVDIREGIKRAELICSCLSKRGLRYLKNIDKGIINTVLGLEDKIKLL